MCILLFVWGLSTRTNRNECRENRNSVECKYIFIDELAIEVTHQNTKWKTEKKSIFFRLKCVAIGTHSTRIECSSQPFRTDESNKREKGGKIDNILSVERMQTFAQRAVEKCMRHWCCGETRNMKKAEKQMIKYSHWKLHKDYYDDHDVNWRFQRELIFG